jgi:hypothetical protein
MEIEYIGVVVILIAGRQLVSLWGGLSIRYRRHLQGYVSLVYVFRDLGSLLVWIERD